MRAQRARRPLRSLERRRPGTWLSDRPEDETLTVALSVLCRIWRTPPTVHRFRLLAVEAARWADELPARWQRHGRPFERSLLDEALAAAGDLPPSQPELVVCHQDFRCGNVLHWGIEERRVHVEHVEFARLVHTL